ncbi:type II toxin-antitoxin system YafO family toxin [Pseudomonas sp. CFBP 8772]|uniref:type II toxin-antitoxin system YafO family toxin n=1 Tax=Pseudomonas sp. CFBP 8772 TaxID=2775284 RepID=UPI0017871909|nr:type II toxin-antitoxin system YafO family toxin [Pseudomonas sp. CFBP 8772]
MEVEVEFHKGTFAEFFEPVELKHARLSEILKTEFTEYVRSGRMRTPSIFGRDAPYTQPPQALQACLMHIHIKIPPARFPQGVAQHDRCCPRNRPGEDAALVYVPGELEEHRFLLLAFLWPDAHGRARDRNTMKYLARLARDWRDKN